MPRLVHLILCVWLTASLQAQSLPSQHWGDPEDPTVVFLHGGPGYNAVPFEVTTAEALARAGFFVVSYDRRGEGRNDSLPAAFTFEQTLTDLAALLKSNDVSEATLLGHSFGGVVAVKFAERYPEMTAAVVLCGAPVDLQASLRHIVDRSAELYHEKGDATNLNYIAMLRKMDTTSLQYSSYALAHAMQNGFYRTSAPTQAATDRYTAFGTNPTLKQYAAKMGYAAPQGFWTNEAYTTQDLTDNLRQLAASGTPVFGIYGAEDGLYSPTQLDGLRLLLGTDHVRVIERASHNVFIDRQTVFINTLLEWLR